MKLRVLMILLLTQLHAGEKRPLTFQDIMTFNEISSPVISTDGNWVAYGLRPDRGDGNGIVVHTEHATTYEVERGEKPQITRNNAWAAFRVVPPMLESENAGKEDKPEAGLTLVQLDTGKRYHYNNVEQYILSEDGEWLAVHFTDTTASKKNASPLKTGTELLLNYLPDSMTISIPFVTEYAFDSSSTSLAAAIRDTASLEDRLVRISLNTDNPEMTVVTADTFTCYSALNWDRQGSQLAFVASLYDSAGYPQPGRIGYWNREDGYKVLLTGNSVGVGWTIPFKNELTFTRDGSRLFFGRLPEQRYNDLYTEKEEVKFDTVTSESTLLKKTDVDIWHGKDGRINSHQKKEWEKNAGRTYPSVYHLEKDRFVALTDEAMPHLEWNESSPYAIGRSDEPYLKYITWEGHFYDYYRVDLGSGKRDKIAERVTRSADFSPGGNYVIYYDATDWFSVNLQTLETTNLTKELDVPFENEDHDYPMPAPGYGTAGWCADDAAVLIYDKYDIWKFPLDDGEPMRVTEGRKEEMTFRIKTLDPDKEFFGPDEKVLLEGYHQKQKYTGIYSTHLNNRYTKKLFQNKSKAKLIAKAEDGDQLLYSEQTYNRFPDLQITDGSFSSSKQITDANPQMARFLWGDAELVEWKTEDDIDLQGVLIKPANYEKGKRYPVLVYFYRFFSQRLYDFNQPQINHRPCFPLYTSNGYAVFLPDIRFEIGAPGPSATKCLVSGIDHLIGEGIADPDAIGLHGHSWSGYQTAFVITETDKFACAVAGAPVSNMTSAYSGIRWGSGLARQFQYEMTQSRIGGSLVEMPEKYIANSPVFFAEQINTPLLLMFGDVDEAVPWYQGIELYLSLRRHDKDVIFLQYRDEPHHLKKYPNKLDYAKRMKEYFDYHLKGAEPAAWITNGVPYSGK